MRKLLSLMLVFLLFFTSCDRIKSIDWIQKGDIFENNKTKENETVIYIDYNETNNTTNQTEEKSNEMVIDGMTYFIAKDTVVAMNKKTAIVLDSGKYTASSLLLKYKKKLDALVVTLDEPQKTNGVKYLILLHKPTVIFDNGVPSPTRKEYTRYINRLNISTQIVNKHKTISFPDIEMEFFVPFEKRGFHMNKDYNSIVVKIGNLLYMSNCYGGCEKSVNTEADYIVLAHNGNCPTNSLEFVLDTGAKTIIGTDLCKDFLDRAYLDNLEELSALGIKFKKVENVVGIKDD